MAAVDSSYLPLKRCWWWARTFLTHPVQGFYSGGGNKDPTPEWLQIRSRARLRWRTPSALRTHMHAPDKPAFLSGSGQAAPFLSLPFCPGQQRMMGCQKGIWRSQIRHVCHSGAPPNAPVYGNEWAAANNNLKVGAYYATDGPAFKITLGGWVIMNWERTINSKLGYVTSQPFTVCRGSNEAKLRWSVWVGYYFRKMDGNQVRTNQWHGNVNMIRIRWCSRGNSVTK